VTRSDHLIKTASGKFVDVFEPHAETLDVRDAARSLSQTCRFTGHTSRFWSTAQHSIVVSELCSQINKFWGIVHDLHEAWLVDLPRPVKAHDYFRNYRVLENKLQWTLITAVLDLPWPMPGEVHDVDAAVAYAEANVFLGGYADWPSQPDDRIMPLIERAAGPIRRLDKWCSSDHNSWDQMYAPNLAMELFLQRFDESQKWYLDNRKASATIAGMVAQLDQTETNG
jgi:hypothetical protein